jgi:hypothetical protein
MSTEEMKEKCNGIACWPWGCDIHPHKEPFKANATPVQEIKAAAPQEGGAREELIAEFRKKFVHVDNGGRHRIAVMNSHSLQAHLEQFLYEAIARAEAEKVRECIAALEKFEPKWTKATGEGIRLNLGYNVAKREFIAALQALLPESGKAADMSKEEFDHYERLGPAIKTNPPHP